MNDSYLYSRRRATRRIAALALAGLSVCCGLVLTFSAPGGSLVAVFPEAFRGYALAFLLLAVVAGVGFMIFRSVRDPAVGGEIRLEDDALSFEVRRGSRTERVCTDPRALTFLENDEEALRIGTAEGEFVFFPSGFESTEAYERFRMALTCARYRK